MGGNSGKLDDLPEEEREERKREQGQMIVRQGCSSDHKGIVYASGCQDGEEEKRKQDQPLLQALWLEKIKNKKNKGG